jgi:hypothetical protein
VKVKLLPVQAPPLIDILNNIRCGFAKQVGQARPLTRRRGRLGAASGRIQDADARVDGARRHQVRVGRSLHAMMHEQKAGLLPRELALV